MQGKNMAIENGDYIVVSYREKGAGEIRQVDGKVEANTPTFIQLRTSAGRECRITVKDIVEISSVQM